jgi:hypothetical protein
MIDPIIVLKYSDKILDIVDNRDEFTRGDLQGAIEAIVLTIIRDSKNDLSVDEWIEVGKNNNYN